MLDGFVNTILSNVFRRELIVIGSSTSEWHRVVHVINILLSPLSKVTNETVEVMTLGHIDCAVFVVVYFCQIVKQTYSLFHP